MTPVTTCADCGAELTSPESIENHRGTRCHINHLERSITRLRCQVVVMNDRCNKLEDQQARLKTSIAGLLAAHIKE